MPYAMQLLTEAEMVPPPEPGELLLDKLCPLYTERGEIELRMLAGTYDEASTMKADLDQLNIEIRRLEQAYDEATRYS